MRVELFGVGARDCTMMGQSSWAETTSLFAIDTSLRQYSKNSTRAHGRPVGLSNVLDPRSATARRVGYAMCESHTRGVIVLVASESINILAKPLFVKKTRCLHGIKDDASVIWKGIISCQLGR